MSTKIRAKLNRGPEHGKYMMVPGDRVEVAATPNFAAVYRRGPFDTDLQVDYRRGCYQKSYRRLKDGSYVFEWMGWYDGRP